MMPVILTDVAQVAGVSVATASRVLSHSDHPVNSQTRERVLNAANTLGYRPNLIARSLRLERTFTIGVVLQNVAEFFSSNILRGILDHFDGTAYSVNIMNTYYDEQLELETIKTLIQRSAEGIIFIDTALHSADAIALSSNIPGVFVNRRYRFAEQHCVLPDNRRNAQVATEHLVKLGHCRIAYIGGPEGWEASHERHAGYRDVLRQSGIPYQPALVAEGDWQIDSGYRAAQYFAALAEPPTAIFASSDRMALGAIYALQDSGRKVPEDMAIVGFDNRNFTELVRPSITTVSLPGYEMGQTAARLLLEQIEEKSLSGGMIHTSGQLFIRESCGAR